MTAQARSACGRNGDDSPVSHSATAGWYNDHGAATGSRSALIVEDDKHAAPMLVRLFHRIGWRASVASDGRAGLDTAVVERPDFVLLDLYLPRMSGIDVCKGIRSAGLDVPIVILTASNCIEDCLAAFAAGADDYMTKPMNPRELAARVKARTRVSAVERVIGNVHLDLRRKRAFCLGRDMRMTRIEFDLLHILADHLDRPVSVTDLAREVWGHHTPLKSDTYRVTVAHVRKKLRAHAATVSIPAAQSNGYMLRLMQ